MLLVSSAFLAATETAFFSLSSNELSRLRQSAARPDQQISEIMANSIGFRLQLLVLNLTVKIVFIAVATASMAGLMNSKAALIISLAAQILMISFPGEIIPRIYARKHRLILSKATARWWIYTNKLSEIFTEIYVFLRKQLNALFHITRSPLQELTQALELAGNDTDSGNDREILQGVVNFGSLAVKDIMHPVEEITAINVDSNFAELVDSINRSGHSRIPVYRQTLDTIEGVLFIKDLLPYLNEGQDFDWPKILRTGFFVPDTKKIDLLLKDFQEKHVHLAIVRNNLGQTCGLITLEDLIEEIIREINDQPEVGEGFRKIGEASYLFDGQTRLEDFFKILDIDDPSIREHSRHESLADFIVEFNDDLPRVGDELYHEQFTFVIEEIEQKRIKKVRVNVHQQA